MIKREDLVKIGRFNKPHGIKGELSFTFTDDSFDESECSFLICELDDIFVPFRLEEYRFKSASTALVKLKNIHSDEQARLFTNLDVYFPKKYMNNEPSDDAATWDYFLKYSLVDETEGEIGKIIDVDDSTINTLFIVDRNGEEIMVPAAEEFIRNIDEKQRILLVKLPEGILDLNN